MLLSFFLPIISHHRSSKSKRIILLYKLNKPNEKCILVTLFLFWLTHLSHPLFAHKAFILSTDWGIFLYPFYVDWASLTSQDVFNVILYQMSLYSLWNMVISVFCISIVLIVNVIFLVTASWMKLWLFWLSSCLILWQVIILRILTLLCGIPTWLFN